MDRVCNSPAFGADVRTDNIESGRIDALHRHAQPGSTFSRRSCSIIRHDECDRPWFGDDSRRRTFRSVYRDSVLVGVRRHGFRNRHLWDDTLVGSYDRIAGSTGFRGELFSIEHRKRDIHILHGIVEFVGAFWRVRR